VLAPDVPATRLALGPFVVSAIGFGAMRLTGPGVFGPPPDRDEAIRVLREAVESGVDHIDTSQYYGPAVVNELIREALHPYPSDLVLVSKVGAARDSRGGIFAYDEPKQLRQGIEENLRTLQIDALPVVNLRLMRGTPPDAFFDDQLAAMIAARNAYHLIDRRSAPVLEECAHRGIAFVPFAPLGSGATGKGSVLELPEVIRVAARLNCEPAQVALVWLLATGDNILLIPGTSTLTHLRTNLAATTVRLDPEAIHSLSAQ
jgi:pyridoxine 4-dehydrogenase